MKLKPDRLKYYGATGDGVVARALAAHQCGFFAGYSGFPLTAKNNSTKFQFDLGSECHGLSVVRLLKVSPSFNKVDLFILLTGSGFIFSPMSEIDCKSASARGDVAE